LCNNFEKTAKIDNIKMELHLLRKKCLNKLKKYNENTNKTALIFNETNISNIISNIYNTFYNELKVTINPLYPFFTYGKTTDINKIKQGYEYLVKLDKTKLKV
jgi:hypothetical protein